MPVDYTHVQGGGVLVSGTGVVTGSEIVDVNRALYDTPAGIAAIRYQLCDLTEVDDIRLTNLEISELARQDSKAGLVNPNMIIAVVASKDVVYGLARMWDSTVDEKAITTRVFRDRRSAEDWIELELVRQRNAGIGSGTGDGRPQ